MKWKEICKCKGYKSLKASYLCSVQQNPVCKDSYAKDFKAVIKLLQRKANWEGKTLCEVLDESEEKRASGTYLISWRNFYAPHNKFIRAKRPRPVVYKPLGALALHKGSNPIYKLRSIRAYKRSKAREERKLKGKKERWTSERKARKKKNL